MNRYWAERQAEAQDKLTAKSVKQVEKELKKYYGKSMEKIIGQFEKTYNRLLLDMEEGRTPTPADLYKLDRYWKMVGQLRNELQTLGDKQISLMGKYFELHFFEIYYSFAIPGESTFTTIDAAAARQIINQIWCADGKNWSQRIWKNTDLLQQSLNDGLIECVVTGKKPDELTKLLAERFDVSYNRADRIVRTEMRNIQTQAAKQRYEDYGLKEYEILGNEDDTCGNHSVDCHRMNGKKFKYAEMSVGYNAPPFHPNCRCCIVPVVDID